MRAPSPHSWTYNLLTFDGTPIRAHGSLLFFIGWIAFERLGSSAEPVAEAIFVLSILACLLIHELGHVLVARFFGLSVRESVLYPFGGVYSLQGELKPSTELAISLAGPFMSIIGAALLAPWCDFSQDFSSDQAGPIPLPHKIFLTNILLALGNFIPGIPLDFGRALRAILTLSRVPAATQVCARLGQVVGLFLFLVGLFYREVLLIVLGGVIFSLASQEHWIERSKSLCGPLTVADVMSGRDLFLTFTHGTTISRALTVSLKSLQPLFPVLHGEDLVGVVQRESLLQSGAWDLEESYVSSIMDREFDALEPKRPLGEVIEFLQQYPQEAVVVVEGKQLVGLLLRDKIFEFLLVKEIQAKNKSMQANLDDEF